VRSAPGLAIQIEKPMNDALYHDLSTDKNMGWVRRDSWLTYMSLSAPAQTVTYDLGISPAGVVMTAPFGTPPMQVVDGRPAAQRAPYGGPTLPVGTPWVALIILWLAAVSAIAAATWRLRRLADLSAGRYLQLHS
jgi:hypothetical protein